MTYLCQGGVTYLGQCGGGVQLRTGVWVVLVMYLTYLCDVGNAVL